MKRKRSKKNSWHDEKEKETLHNNQRSYEYSSQPRFNSPQQDQPPVKHRTQGAPVMEFESPLPRNAYSEKYQHQSPLYHHPSNLPEPYTPSRHQSRYRQIGHSSSQQYDHGLELPVEYHYHYH
jgi:hypothetical protein